MNVYVINIADNFAILQILIENKCCLVNVCDLIMTASKTEKK